MKISRLAILLCLLISFAGNAQYYLRGEVRNKEGNVIPNVKIVVASKGDFPYFSGVAGAFGIPSSLAIDTIELSCNGYETLRTAVVTSKFQSVILKSLNDDPSTHHLHLLSFTKNKPEENTNDFFDNGESYSNTAENDFTEAEKYPETAFTLNVDRASYSNIRRFISTEGSVPREAVRIEEMLNYFDFDNPGKNNSTDFLCNTRLIAAPWKTETGNQILFVNLHAPKLNVDSFRQSNFIFLIDVSGSMDDAKRLPLLQAAFKMLVDHLRDRDTVAIVTYGGAVGVQLGLTSASEKNKIYKAIDALAASGETPGGAGIQTAYELAERSFSRNSNNRIILATDGDFNVGQTSEQDLEDLILQHKQSGIYLTCLGVGMGNYKDSKLEMLANKGNGNFAYIDNLQEAEKVLIKEFTKTLYAVADDAYLSVSFNADLVKAYRLIGYDNKKEDMGDSSKTLEGGEVGSGHSTMAAFEIIPAQKALNLNSSNNSGYSIATFRMQYKLPGTGEAKLQTFNAPYSLHDFENADSSLRFAAAVIMFGELLKQSAYAQMYKWSDLEKIASACVNKNNAEQKEFLDLVEKETALANPVKTKHKKKKNEE